MSKPGSTRRRVATAIAALLLTLTPITTTATPAQAAPLPLSGFVVANDGRLYQASGTQGDQLRLVDGVVAPPGAGISTVRQADGTPALFLIGTHGGLVVGTSRLTAPGLVFTPMGPSGVATPGARIAAISAPDGIHVFFPGTNGSVYTAVFGQYAKPGPVAWVTSPPGLAPATASIAVGWDATTGPSAAFVGVDGALYSVRRLATGAWTTSPISPAGVAPPGGGVAILTNQNSTRVVYAGTDGTLWETALSPFPEPWQPRAISVAGTINPGAQLVAFPNGPKPDPWQDEAVFFAGPDGAITVAVNLGAGWLGPTAVTPPGVAQPGAALALAADSDNPDMFVGWCGNDRWWWVRWRLILPPPPPPPWYGDIITLRPVAPIQPGANVSAAMWSY